MLNQFKELWDNFMISGSIATLCGALSYLMKVAEGKPFRLWEFVLNASVSGVCGMACYAFLRQIDSLSLDMIGACCGLAGWMGTKLIKLLEDKVQKRLQ